MEKFEISVAGTDELFNFQVVNKGTESCEYEVYAGRPTGCGIRTG